MPGYPGSVATITNVPALPVRLDFKKEFVPCPIALELGDCKLGGHSTASRKFFPSGEFKPFRRSYVCLRAPPLQCQLQAPRSSFEDRSHSVLSQVCETPKRMPRATGRLI